VQALDGRAARLWALHALDALGAAREEIDALNVFPVPDGDTGTNMYLTLEAAVTAAAQVPAGSPVAQVAEAFARGALLGARGNSGVIGAQLLRGWADTLARYESLDATAAVEGFRRADEQAWQAVGDPVEGTILSVSRAAAAAAAAAPPELEAVVEAAAVAARQALALTTGQLPALARAGVVDAGGRGYVVVLDTLANLVAGISRHRPGREPRPPALPVVDLAACLDVEEGTPAGPGFEVMYLLDAADDAVPALRERLMALGESLVVVGGGGLWNVHVHTDDAGAAVEAGIAAGHPRGIRITHLPTGGEAGSAEPGRPGAPRRGGGADRPAVGLVAVAAGPGLVSLFRGAGAVAVPGGPGARPSTARLLAAVHETRAAAVVVLPNDGDTRAVAQAAAAVARSEGVRVSVLPTRAQVHGLAAAAVHDPGRGFDDDVVAMSNAAGATRDGAVTVAARDGLTSAGPCKVGDVLGVVDGDFAVVGDDLEQVANEVLDRLLSGGGELVTLVVGAGGHDGLARDVAVHARRFRRPIEVQVLDGGQPRYPLLIGVE
jgi:DAK2 domain fusion protein YloV